VVLNLVFMLPNRVLGFMQGVFQLPNNECNVKLYGKKYGQSYGGDPLYVNIEDPVYDVWRLDPVIEMIKKGSVGVIPTDTSYAFVCDLFSREGVDRVLRLKQAESVKKPLALLCKDMSSISKYTKSTGKTVFKLLKECFPGPYTLILSASPEVPRAFVESKTHRKSWKRREVGVRIPNDDTCLAILQELDNPLLCSSVPSSKEEYNMLSYVNREASSIMAAWYNQVDFVVDTGPIPSDNQYSTVVDLTASTPIILREGSGPITPFEPFLE